MIARVITEFGHYRWPAHPYRRGQSVIILAGPYRLYSAGVEMVTIEDARGFRWMPCVPLAWLEMENDLERAR